MQASISTGGVHELGQWATNLEQTMTSLMSVLIATGQLEVLLCNCMVPGILSSQLGACQWAALSMGCLVQWAAFSYLLFAL